MKKTLLSLLTAGLLATAATAQDNSLLYAVTGNGLAQPSYLYGTFHLVCPNDLIISDSLKKVAAVAQQLYLEIDMDQPNLQNTMMQGMMLTDGKTIKDLMSAEDYTVVDSYLQKKLSMGLAQMGRFKPIALYSFMAMAVLGCQPVSYDLTLMEIAAKDKKEVLGLENLEDQLALFDKIPYEKQLSSLADIARKPNDMEQENVKLLAAYKTQDLASLMKQIKESKFAGGMEELETDLLDNRNQNWIPVIEKAAKEKPTLFAFGAGHLGGDKGVIQLLRAKGYVVKGVK
jgi:uncharacterized protein